MIGYIYKLVSVHIDKVYVGSTTKTLNQRLTRHKADSKVYKNGKCRHTTSFNLFELGDVSIELLEEVSYDDKKELHMKEAEWIKKSYCVNKVIPLQSNKEWRILHKEKIQKYKKEKYALAKETKLNQ